MGGKGRDKQRRGGRFEKGRQRQGVGEQAPTPPQRPVSFWRRRVFEAKALWRDNKRLAIFVGAVVALVTAWMTIEATDRREARNIEAQGRREADAAKARVQEQADAAKGAVMAAMTNVANEIGSFLELAASRPVDQLDALYAAHEIKMNELRAPLMAANVALGVRDPQAKDGFEKVIAQYSSFDGCIARVHDRLDPAPRQGALRLLRMTYRSFSANIASRLPLVASGGFDDDQFLQLQCPR